LYLYVELWKARPTWFALPREQRAAYASRIAQGCWRFVDSGIELIGWAPNAAGAHRADYTWLALWKMPSAEHVQRFEESVERSGWHEYFEQVNAWGELSSVEAVLGRMARVEV
jgi:hypothetical protein